MPVIELAPVERPAPGLKLPWATLLRGAALGLAGAVLLEVINVVAWRNTHEVVPGVLYRTAQPSAHHLASLIDRYGIRTVVNLRGSCDSAPWFLAEARLTNQRAVSQEDIAFSAARLPSVTELRQLVAVIDRSEYPLLFHCNRGVDRTGLAIAIAHLLHTDTTVAQARRHLSLRHGHLSVGRTRQMHRFLDLYENWLAATAQPHSRAAFRQFAERDYCPGPCRATFTVLEPELLGRVPAHSTIGLRVRCLNTSVETWQLTPATNAGIHFEFRVYDTQNRPVTGGKAGLLYAAVTPGESIEVTLALPPLPRGRYSLWMDLFEGQHCYSYQAGLEPFLCALEVL